MNFQTNYFHLKLNENILIRFNKSISPQHTLNVKTLNKLIKNSYYLQK